MSARAIREDTGKRLLNANLSSDSGAALCRFAHIDEETDWDMVVVENPWLKTEVGLKV
jgi:ATP citrate (pro-S)-lyase